MEFKLNHIHELVVPFDEISPLEGSNEEYYIPSQWLLNNIKDLPIHCVVYIEEGEDRMTHDCSMSYKIALETAECYLLYEDIKVIGVYLSTDDLDIDETEIH